jgi:hypothetical protein
MYTHFVVYECADKATESYVNGKCTRHTYCFNQGLQININFELLVTIRIKLASKLQDLHFHFDSKTEHFVLYSYYCTIVILNLVYIYQ